LEWVIGREGMGDRKSEERKRMERVIERGKERE